MALGSLTQSPGPRNSITTARPALQVAAHRPGGQLPREDLGLGPSAVMPGSGVAVAQDSRWWSGQQECQPEMWGQRWYLRSPRLCRSSDVYLGKDTPKDPHPRPPHVTSWRFSGFFAPPPFLGPHPQHMEVPRLGVKSELQLLAYTAAHSNAGSY